MTKPGTDLNDINSAVRMRDIIKKLVTTHLNETQPLPRYATVDSIDNVNGICNVLFPGDVNTTAVGISNLVAPSTMNLDFEFNNTVVVVGGEQNNLHVIEVVNNWPYIRNPVIEEPFISGYSRLLTIEANETHGAAYFQAISSALPALNDAWFMGAWQGFQANTGMIDLVVDQDGSGGQVKKYSFGLTNASVQNTDWQNLMPTFESGNAFGSDFTVEVKMAQSFLAAAAQTTTVINLSTNPANTVSLAGWGTIGGASAPSLVQATNTTLGIYGSNKCCRAVWKTSAGTANGAVQSFPTTIGQQYTIQVYLYVPTGMPAVKVGIVGVGTTATLAVGAALYVPYTFTATATSHQFEVIAAASQTAGQYVDMTYTMFEAGNVAHQWFDGSFTSTGTSEWNGVAGLSTSTQTYTTGSITSTSDYNGFALRVRRIGVGTIESAANPTTCYRAQLWIHGERPYPSMFGSDLTTPGDFDVSSFGDQAAWINGGCNHPIGTYPVPVTCYGVATTAGADGNGLPYTNGGPLQWQPTNYGGSLPSPILSSLQRANLVLSGGGAMFWDGAALNWSQRLIVMGLGMNEMCPSGYWDIGPCAGTAGVPIYYASGGGFTQTIAGGVLLTATWQALYYELPLFGLHTFKETNFRVVDYRSGAVKVPAHWVFIGGWNPDAQSAEFHTGTGDILDAPNVLSLGTNIAAFNTALTPHYQKMNGQYVHLNGVAKATATISAGATIATLPAGYRPAQQESFVVAGTGAAGTFYRVDVLNTGAVNIILQGIVSGSYVTLSSISFIAAL